MLSVRLSVFLVGQQLQNPGPNLHHFDDGEYCGEL